MDALEYLPTYFREFIDLLLLFVLVGLCTNIRNKSFYIVLFILAFPLTLLYITDSLLTWIVLLVIFSILRRSLWKENPQIRIDDLLGFLHVFAIYGITNLFSSIIVTSIFNGLSINNEMTSPVVICFHWVCAITLGWIGRKRILSQPYTLEEKKIYTIQLGVFLAFSYLFTEILTRMQVLGVFQFVLVGFIVAQFAFTITFTFLVVKRNQKKLELQNLKEQMKMMDAYMRDVEENYQTLRKFRHDYNNLLLGLRTQPHDSDINQQYLEEMIEYSHQMMDLSVMRFSGINNLKISSVKSLMIAKLSQAEQSQLKVNFECLIPVEAVDLDEVKLIRIVGILIDNAIEAAQESQQKKLSVLIINTQEAVEFSIENSYSGNLPSLQAMNQAGFSSKGKGRGLGLANIQEILSGSPQAEMTHYASDGVFVSTLSIRKSE